MPRVLSGGFDDDPVYTDVAGEDIERRQIEDPDPERVPLTHCRICGRPLDAQLTCVACGDETDVERMGDGGTREGPATPRERHSSAERPDEEQAA